ncbi:MAG TPA: MTH1187 family thiamine-binding protein [Nitrososphaeraceae archaeon]|nr:MTH1187 family thiamine-binding protein [Nitrososphaeraceae archaeon]
MSKNETSFTAEISIIPITTNNNGDTSMSKEIALVYDAISQIQGLKIILTAMGTQVESNNLDNILQAIKISHMTLRNIGIERIISSIRIDERLDKINTLEGKIKSVKDKIK